MDKVQTLATAFMRLLAIFRQEGGDPIWIERIEQLIELLHTFPKETQKQQEVLRYIDSQYSSLHTGHGPGTLSEFFVWRDDFNERCAANQELDDIKLKIFECLNK